MHFIPVYLIFIPVLTALFLYVVKSRHMNWLALVAQALMTVLLVLYYRAFSGNYEDTMIVLGGWNEWIGISLVNDEISVSFMFLSVFSWWMVLIYTFEKGNTNHNFLFFLMFLQGVFLGLLQTNDLFNMFVFMELITILVTILIAFKKTGDAYRAGLFYLLISKVAMMMFLLSIILVYNSFGTINILLVRDAIAATDSLTVVRFSYALFMVAVMVKSAFVPLYAWLPRAHGVAQSGISALLSGLVVKGGLYLFIRLNQMYEFANLNYTDFFYWIGALTAVVGVMFALSQKDMKQILAYHTISQIGIVMMGLSKLHDPDMFIGGFLHIFNHALFKSLLFLGAGVIISAYRTKKVTDIRGVMRTMPFVSIFMIVGMLSITGAPFFNGFISKAIIKYGVIDSGVRYWILFIVNIGTATSFIKMSQIFFGPKTMTIRIRKPLKNLTLMSLAFACVMLGNFYIPISEGFFGFQVRTIDIGTWANFFDYFLALSIGYVFYRFVIAPDPKAVRYIREHKMTFQQANYLFVVMIIVLLTVFVWW